MMTYHFNSILTKDSKHCYLCGSCRLIEIHHIFGGANRKKSTQYGLIVPLCHFCHNEPPNGVHFNKERRETLQDIAQREFEKKYPNLDFMKIFHRNYKKE